MKRGNHHRKATAYHEAGHAVAAFFLGFKTRQVTVKPGKDYSGLHSEMGRHYLEGLDCREITPLVRDRIERRVIVRLAGAAAQRRFNRRSYRHYHADDDHQQAVDLLFRIASSGKEVTAYCRWLGIRTENIVACHWQEIKNVADALIEQETLDGATITQVIRQAMKQAVNS